RHHADLRCQQRPRTTRGNCAVPGRARGHPVEALPAAKPGGRCGGRGMIFAELIDTGALLKVVLYSTVSAIGVTAIFSVGIVGVTRYDERRRAGNGGGFYLALALLCAAIVTA